METSEVTAGECIRPHIVNARDMLGFMLKTKVCFKKKNTAVGVTGAGPWPIACSELLPSSQCCQT